MISAQHATSEPLRTSFHLEHIARAADSLPAAGEPVWYPCHAGSRRGDAPSILFLLPHHPISQLNRAPPGGNRRGAVPTGAGSQSRPFLNCPRANIRGG